VFLSLPPHSLSSLPALSLCSSRKPRQSRCPRASAAEQRSRPAARHPSPAPPQRAAPEDLSRATTPVRRPRREPEREACAPYHADPVHSLPRRPRDSPGSRREAAREHRTRTSPRDDRAMACSLRDVRSSRVPASTSRVCTDPDRERPSPTSFVCPKPRVRSPTTLMEFQSRPLLPPPRSPSIDGLEDRRRALLFPSTL
jgi:hypothetical protein